MKSSQVVPDPAFLLFIGETVWHTLRESLGGIFMEVIQLCSFLNKMQLCSRKNRFILIKNQPLHVCCMFRPVPRPSSDMSVQKYYKDVSFCINIHKDRISKGRNMQHIRKDTIWMKINLCCVRMNKCSLSPRGIWRMVSQTIFINFRAIRRSLATKSLTFATIPRFRGVSVTKVLHRVQRSHSLFKP